MRLGDVSIGAVLKHSRDWNLARECVIGSGLAAETPAFDVQRACGTSLEAAILIGNKIALGQIDAGIAGGTDSVSDPPMVWHDGYRRVLMQSYRARSIAQRLAPWLRVRPRHFAPVLPDVSEPRTGLSMGQSTELTAKAWKIERSAQDALALESHRRAATAWDAGFFDDIVVPYQGVDRDNNVRPDSSLEKLAGLKPAFDRTDRGTLTAGNSSPLTDGAAATLLASEDWARERGLPVLARLRYGKVAAVDFLAGEGLRMRSRKCFATWVLASMNSISTRYTRLLPPRCSPHWPRGSRQSFAVSASPARNRLAVSTALGSTCVAAALPSVIPSPQRVPG